MANNLRDFILINITRLTAAVPQAGFGTVLVLGTNSTLIGRYKKYDTTDLSGLAAELTGGVNDPEYKAASAIASQNKLPDFAIGRRASGDSSYTVTLNSIVDESSDFYGIVLADAGTDTARVIFDADFVTANTIDGEINGSAIGTVTFSTDQATTAGLLATAIQALTDVSTAVVDPTDVTDRTILITGASGTSIRPENFVVASGASQAEASYTGALKDREDIAAWALANKRFFVTQTSEDDAINKTLATDEDSLLAILNNERVAVIPRAKEYHDEFIDAALLGLVLSYLNDTQAGSWSAQYKKLQGITPDVYSISQRSNILDKNGSTYEERRVNVLNGGRTTDGEWIDIIMFGDWQEAKISELVWYLFVNTLRVPHTDPGYDQVASKIEQALSIGQQNGGISPDDFHPDTKVRTGGFEVTVPFSRDVPANDKANRVLKNIKFKGYLSGAIHKTEIAGVFTY